MEQGGVSESAPKDKMQVLRVQVEEVTEKMKGNVERILEREEKGLVILATSEKMEKEAQHFKQTSQNVARTYWWKNVKLVVVIVVVVLIIVLIIVLLATGVIPVSAPAANPSIKP